MCGYSTSNFPSGSPPRYWKGPRNLNFAIRKGMRCTIAVMTVTIVQTTPIRPVPAQLTLKHLKVAHSNSNITHPRRTLSLNVLAHSREELKWNRATFQGNAIKVTKIRPSWQRQGLINLTVALKNIFLMSNKANCTMRDIGIFSVC